MTVLSIFKNKNNTNNNNKITLKTTTTTRARAISKIHTTFLLPRFLRWWCATGSRTPFSSSVRLAWPTARSDRALILVILLFAYFVASSRYYRSDTNDCRKFLTCYTFHVRLCARVWVIARSRSLWRVCVFALIYNFTLVRTTFIFVLIAFSCVSLMSPGSVLIAKQKHLAEHFQEGTRKSSYTNYTLFCQNE